MEQSSTIISEGPSPGVWELHRPTIKRLYLDEDKTLPEVKEIMKRDFDFTASNRMYKRRLKLWKIDGKNLKRPQVKQIARRKVERDAVGKPSKFFIKGREVDMDNLRQYLKKHGFSSLEELNQVASPVAYNCDVVCTTPAQSPMSYAIENDTPDDQDLPQDFEICIPRYDQSPMALSIIERDPMSARRPSSLHHFLSLSSEARSRRLLSLSPIPRTPALPKALSMPEQILSTFSLYLKGSFEAGAWETAADGHLCSKNTSDSDYDNGWIYSVDVAVKFIREKRYVQSRQVLSQMCAKLELCIKFESPSFMTDLFYATSELYEAGLREIAAMVVSHGCNVATERFGAFHPVSQVCGMLQQLDTVRRELRSRLLQCQLDLLEKELGPWHIDTALTRSDLMLVIDTSEAVGRARAWLSACEETGAKYHSTRFRIVDNLAWTLMKDGQYAAAEQNCREILDAIDATTDFTQAYYFKARAFWVLSCIVRMADNNIIEAEGFAQQAVVESAATWGWRDAETINYMVDRAKLLRMLGKLEEAGEVDNKVQDILGPPEIKELLC